MPLAVATAGLAVSVPMLCLLCVFSFVTCTCIVEAMSGANAVRKIQAKRRRQPADVSGSSSSVNSQLIDVNGDNGDESPNSYDDDQDPLLPRQASRNKELFQISEVNFNIFGLSKLHFSL